MPTYEYECRSCHHTFEKFQSMSDQPVKVCPKCGGVVHRKIGGGLGIIFKGPGFYCTDSRKTSSAALTEVGSPSSAGSEPSKSEQAAKPEKAATAETSSTSSSKSSS
ncbi:MAG TPA: zinc ribbon domain-containing protein [Spirochaetales bacterium]|nr:zinc ribbon domain-containing protein [Spirochaetales bacterium]